VAQVRPDQIEHIVRRWVEAGEQLCTPLVAGVHVVFGGQE
jgi:hypothetical protein